MALLGDIDSELDLPCFDLLRFDLALLQLAFNVLAFDELAFDERGDGLKYQLGDGVDV